MVIAHLFFGPLDGECLILPMDQEQPWSRIVIPRLGQIQLIWAYLQAGRFDQSDWAYLFDDTYAGLSPANAADLSG